MSKKIQRNEDEGMILGVCAGIADYFDIDPTIVRLLWAFSILFLGTGVLLYILCVFIIPSR